MALTITTYRLPDGVTSKIEKGAVELIRQELEKIGAEGDFLATAKEQITIRNFRFKYVRFENGQLIIKVKPGDNSTAWTWWVTPPTGADGDRLGRLLSGEPDDDPLAALTAASEPAPAEPVEVTTDPEEIAPAPTPKSDVVGSVTGQTIAERYDAAKRRAQPYKDRLDKIEAIREEIQHMFTAIEQKEAEVKKLETASQQDSAGKDAFEKLVRIEQLLEL